MHLDPAVPHVSLREVTAENIDAVIGLSVGEHQRGLVASTSVSIAQAHYAPGAWFRAVYAGEDPVGFTLLALSGEGPADYLWRFLIDGRHQGRGYGRRALELVIDFVRSRPQASELLLSHQERDGNAGPFYRKLGFEYTGEKVSGEPMMRLRL